MIYTAEVICRDCGTELAVEGDVTSLNCPECKRSIHPYDLGDAIVKAHPEDVPNTDCPDCRTEMAEVVDGIFFCLDCHITMDIQDGD